MENKCYGEHEIYVAEVVGVQAEGKVVVITVCRHCDSVQFHEHQVAKAHVPFTLIKGNENVI